MRLGNDGRDRCLDEAGLSCAPPQAQAQGGGASAAAAVTAARGQDVLGYGFWVMTLTHMLTHVFTYVHTTLFPTLRVEFNLSLSELGLIAAIPPLCQTLLSIPAGLLSDRLGSKKLLVVSLSVAIAGALLAGQALTAGILVLAVSLVYVNTTVYHPAAYSFVTRLFSPKGRLRALGIHGAGGTLGVAIGPFSISLLIGALGLGWRQVYLAWAIPLGLGLISVLLIRAEPNDDIPPTTPTAVRAGPGTGMIETQSASQVASLFSLNLVLFLVYLAIRVIATSMSQSFMALYLVEDRRLSESLASLYIGSSTFMGLMAAPIGGFLAVRYGEKRWLLTVLTLAYACFGLAILSQSNAAFVVLYLAFGFLSYLGMAANSAIMAKLSPGKKRGLAYALFFLPGSIMGAVAPLLAASIAEAFSLRGIFYAATAVFFLSLVVLGFGVRVQAE